MGNCCSGSATVPSGSMPSSNVSVPWPALSTKASYTSLSATMSCRSSLVTHAPDAKPAAYGLRQGSVPNLVPHQEQPPHWQSLPSSTLIPHTPHPMPPPQQHAPPSFPSPVMPFNMVHHLRSTAALSRHPYALIIRRPSATQAESGHPPPSGPSPAPGPNRMGRQEFCFNQSDMVGIQECLS